MTEIPRAAHPAAIRRSIVIVNDMLWGGGRERRIVQLIAGLNEHGAGNITLVLLDDRVDYPEVFSLKVNVIKISRSSNRDLSVFGRLFRIIKSQGPCIVNPWSFMSVFYAAPLCLLARQPCVGSFVVDCKPPARFSINWFAMKIGFSLCKRIVSNSAAGHAAYSTPRDKRIVIHNGFDPARLKRAPSPPAEKGSIVIAMIGRLDKQKDFRTYIDALTILQRQGVAFRAFLVGQGGDHEALKAYTAHRNLREVHITGFVSEIDAFISGVDIGVLCTDPAHHAEGISNALMEMMAQGKPVVATNDGGTPEIIRDGTNGILVPSRDAEALAGKLELLIRDERLRKRLGINAADTIATKFSLDEMATKFLQVYDDVA
jgi:glycosyltransferase involved in cell wall biosynthesis